VKTVQVENADEALRWLPANQRLRRYHFNGKEIRPKRVAPGPCPRPWISTLVNWDGSVVPCCFDKNGRHQFGTIKEHHLDHIWNSENYDNFRNAMLTARSSLEICANCSQGLRLYL
jgi:radical SAM protein with 4Fe4S-binding SPASM domain